MAEPAERLSLTESQIVRTLTQLPYLIGPRTSSLLFLGGTRTTTLDPFHPAFLSGVEQRAELVRRLGLLEPRERLLLFLWYVEGVPVTTIAERLSISRVHCYRLRNRALRRMTLGADEATGPMHTAGHGRPSVV